MKKNYYQYKEEENREEVKLKLNEIKKDILRLNIMNFILMMLIIWQIFCTNNVISRVLMMRI